MYIVFHIFYSNPKNTLGLGTLFEYPVFYCPLLFSYCAFPPNPALSLGHSSSSHWSQSHLCLEWLCIFLSSHQWPVIFDLSLLSFVHYISDSEIYLKKFQFDVAGEHQCYNKVNLMYWLCLLRNFPSNGFIAGQENVEIEPGWLPTRSYNFTAFVKISNLNISWQSLCNHQFFLSVYI